MGTLDDHWVEAMGVAVALDRCGVVVDVGENLQFLLDRTAVRTSPQHARRLVVGAVRPPGDVGEVRVLATNGVITLWEVLDSP